MTTPNLELPEWVQNQDQPHATVNMALRVLDCLTQLVIIDRDSTSPPGAPDEGDCYIPASGATDDWTGHEDDVAMFVGGTWVFRTPKFGWKAYVLDEDIDIRFYGSSSGGGWQEAVTS